MKALIKGGLFLALGWLANVAPAQEPQWRAASPKNTNPSPTVPGAIGDTGVRPVSVGQPSRLDPAPAVGSFRPIVRAQVAEEKPAPLPNLLIGEPKTAKPLPKDNGFPPPPSPMPPTGTPSPIFEGLGMTNDGCCGDDCGLRMGRKAWGAAWGGLGTDGCADRGRGWVNAEYLMWWQRAMSVPTLAVTAPVDGAGNPTGAFTSVYDSVPDRMRSGTRFGGGIWFGPCCNMGLDITYFGFSPQRTSATFASSAGVGLFRPFFDTQAMANNAERANMVTIQTTTQLWGIDANIRKKWHCGPNYWLDCFVGFRHLNLSETIDIAEDRTFVPIAGGPTVQAFEQESFGTRNQFNGMQMGLAGEVRLGYRAFFGFSTKLAMGTTHQIINIDGNTTFVVQGNPGVMVGQRGALLAGTTNIGQYTSNRFSVVPEVGVKFGIDVTDHLRLFAGYDFIFWNNVLRPGDQIDTTVNQNFRPSLFAPANPNAIGERRPTVPYRNSDFWAQGFNFGLQYRY